MAPYNRLQLIIHGTWKPWWSKYTASPFFIVLCSISDVILSPCRNGGVGGFVDWFEANRGDLEERFPEQSADELLVTARTEFAAVSVNQSFRCWWISKPIARDYTLTSVCISEQILPTWFCCIRCVHIMDMLCYRKSLWAMWGSYYYYSTFKSFQSKHRSHVL